MHEKNNEKEKENYKKFPFSKVNVLAEAYTSSSQRQQGGKLFEMRKMRRGKKVYDVSLDFFEGFMGRGAYFCIFF